MSEATSVSMTVSSTGRVQVAPFRLLFVSVVLTGSFLLFLIQPLVARFALPLLGGAPNVWNSAMLVFQALLLGGYAYAHMLGKLPIRNQVTIHLSLLSLAVLTLPIEIPDIRSPSSGWEVLWVPLLIGLAIGPVFFLVAAQASLMQRWFFTAPGADNPYALYAASNLGSFAGLLTYPFWLEPRMALADQSRFWTLGYLALIALVALAAVTRWNAGHAATDPTPGQGDKRLDQRTVLFWLALAAVPSGLMLSTTTLLTTDIMAMPLLWVIPLGLYLLSFSVAFSTSGDWANILTRFAPVLLLSAGSLAMISGGQANPAIALAMVGLLFVLAVALHGRLYALRPSPERLTFFYLIVAAGGALGGVFTSLLAPVLFDWVYEHAILLLAAALLLPQKSFVEALGNFWRNSRAGKVLACIFLSVAAVLAWRLVESTSEGNGPEILGLVSALIAIGVLFIGLRWAYLAVLALLMLGNGGISTLELSTQGARSRTYFGVYSVVEPEGQGIRQLNHGTTVHGKQWLDEARHLEPTSYYGRSSGVGIALESLSRDARVGVVGLGAGTLACYRLPGQSWTFFEIDPQILEYSQDGTFSFLPRCSPDARVVIGDARLELAKKRFGFDLLAIDAFSSDSIPLHLMTEEAFTTYGRGLNRDGLLLVHVSNRYIDLAPMVSALANAGDWHGRLRHDQDDLAAGLSPSVWIVLSRDKRRLSQLEQEDKFSWEELPPPSSRAWTDDNASILPILR